MHIPTEKCTFVQRNAFSCRKMHLPALKKKQSFLGGGAHGRKPQEIAEGFQGSRIKNTSRLSQENRRDIFFCHPLSGPVRDTPPYRAIPFRDSIAEGGIAPICLVFIGYRVGIAEIPILRGRVSHLHFACSPRGKCSEKGEGVSHPIGHVETPKTP